MAILNSMDKTDLQVDRITEILRGLLPTVRESPVALHEPCLAGHEWDYVKDCLDSGWVSSVGSYVNRFERQLEELLGVGNAVACVNGTAALHVCLELAGVAPGDEVIVPALTFVATANAVTYLGALPHFADSDAHTLGLDPAKLADYLEQIAEPADDGCRNRKSGRRIAAVLPMHTFGHPVDMDPLNELAARHGIAVVEDAAEALGSRYKGRACGGLARLAALSFNGNKIVTTGGGGAVLTDDDELARLAEHVTTTARVKHQWAFLHDRIGYNYRMPNLNAALGCAQLEQLAGFLAAKRAFAARYAAAFEGVPGLRIFAEPDFAESNYWLNALLLDEEVADLRDDLLARLNDSGILARPAWTLMHRLPMYRECPRMDLSVAESLERRLINLPSSAILEQGAA